MQFCHSPPDHGALKEMELESPVTFSFTARPQALYFLLRINLLANFVFTMHIYLHNKILPKGTIRFKK